MEVELAILYLSELIKGKIDNDNIKLALDSLKKIREVTLIVVPEAVNTAKETCKNIQTDVIMHCGEMQNRFAIFDVHPKEKMKTLCRNK